jgi:DNA-directed RNA polymerase III subunit RPC8
MFVLLVLRDTLRLPPAELHPQIKSTLADHIHAKYANKVLTNQGLCICVHGLDSVGPPIIYGSDGAAHVRVQFRLAVFRPFAGEVLTARVKACDPTGILVSVEFFDHIFIPAHELQYPSHFNKQEQLWVWQYQGHELFMDLEEEIRVRVTDLRFTRQRAGPQLTEEELAVMAPGAAAATLAPSVVEAAAAKKAQKKPTIASFEPPMKVIVSGSSMRCSACVCRTWSSARLRRQDAVEAAGLRLNSCIASSLERAAFSCSVVSFVQ